MRFDSPLAFLLLIFIPLLVEEPWRTTLFCRLPGLTKLQDRSAIRFAARIDLDTLPQSLRLILRKPMLTVFHLTAFLCLVTALARPQAGVDFVPAESSGRDIMLLLDVSGSMEALDFYLEGERTERLTALKTVVKDFIQNRRGDRLGLVVFGTDVFTQCPLTLDHLLLETFVDELEVGMAGDNTSLGDGIAIALKRIKDIDAESKVLVLVTDGRRTSGQLSPMQAARIAEKLGIRIYSIGVGGKESAPFQAKNIFGLQTLNYHDIPLDEKTLKEVAKITHGQYFNAQKTEDLRNIYSEIDKLEERTEEIFEFIEYEELFLLPLALGFLLFIAAEVLKFTIFGVIP